MRTALRCLRGPLSVALGLFFGWVAESYAAPKDVELVGLRLASPVYPYFEYVTSFNLDQVVSVAVDPQLFPEVRGQTCDIVTVAPKTQAQWDANPYFAPVIAPIARSFGSTIQAATHDLGLGSVFGSRAEPCYVIGGTERCIGLGKGFDVILDCDRNGKLSDADFIDGHGDGAGFYVVHDTTETGLPVMCTDYAADGISTPKVRQRTYAPANVAQLTTPLPLVVISHGNGHEYWWYDYLQKHLASYGYVVMAHENNTGPFSDMPLAISNAAQSTLEHTDRLLDLVGSTACPQRVPPANQSPCGVPEVSDFNVCDLAGKIDPHRIVWIGHSRGGNAVVWAYNRVAAPAGTPWRFVPSHFGAADIALISSMAPVDSLIAVEGGEQLARPGPAPYHLIWSAADGDVTGAPNADVGNARHLLAFQLLDRASGPKHSLYIHGGGHGYFHENCPPHGVGADCGQVGDSTLEPSQVQRIVRGTYLPLLKHYLEANVPARDFLWRPWERFKPTGVAGGTPVALEYSAGPSVTRWVVDDYETAPAVDQASSGALVSQNLAPPPIDPAILMEGSMEDEDCHYDFYRSFIGASCDGMGPNVASCVGATPGTCPGRPCGGTCTFDCSGCDTCVGAPPCALACAGGTGFVSAQPMNGLTRSRAGIESRGLALGWQPGQQEARYAFEFSPARDLRPYTYVSFRVAQLPRHPDTMKEQGDVHFTVRLVDAAGRSSAIRTDAYPGGAVEPFDRRGPRSAVDCHCSAQVYCCNPDGCNPSLSDPGWQAEFETVRIRLTDFLTGGTGLNLREITVLRFEFGSASGSPVGRVAFDDIAFVAE